MILKFRVYEQTISLQSTKAEPRQGSRDYLELQFSFSSDWNDLLKYVYIQHREVSVPHDLVEGSVIVDEYFTEQTEFNVTLFGKSADGSVEVPTNVVTVFLKESNNLWEKDAPEPQNSWIVQVVDARDEALAAAIRAENAAIHQPYPNEKTGTWWVWNAAVGEYKDTGISCSAPVDATLTQSGQAADAAEVGTRLSSLSEKIADGVSWNELKDKPFYLEKTRVVELTKDDFTVNDQDGRFKYMYRSTPKLDWFTSAESIAFEIEIVDTNGRRYTATQDRIDVRIVRDTTDDDREYWSCYSDLFEIVSGVDLDLYYDDEYYYKDEWGVLVNYSGIEFSEINIKIYRVDVKKIPEICLDAAIGKTAITVGSVLEDSEAEMAPSVIVPYLRIPVNPTSVEEEIYFDRGSERLRTSGYLFPYRGDIDYTFQKVIPTTAGSSISFDISSEGDTLWDTIGWYSPWRRGRYLSFRLRSSYSGGGIIEFLSSGNPTSSFYSAVASSNLGHLYTVVFKYTNSYKTLNVTLKCVV